MYQVNARIRGTSPILQHRFGAVVLGELMQGANKQTGKKDYSLEWMSTMYVNQDGLIFQPAAHIEAALIKTAAMYAMRGKKTYKDAFRGYVYVTPDEIPHIWAGDYVSAPDESLLTQPTDNLSVSIMRVVVQRSAVARSRLQVAEGWELAFTVEVQDDQIRPDVLKTILIEAGRSVGIGDNRPRYGRFELIRFEQV